MIEMAVPSRKEKMVNHLMIQHRKKKHKAEEREEEPDPERVEELKKLWKKTQKK